MQIRAAEISDIIREQIREYEKQLEVRETGVVLSAGDGGARDDRLERRVLERRSQPREVVADGRRRAGFLSQLEERPGVASTEAAVHERSSSALRVNSRTNRS